MSGLSKVLRARTALEPAEPMAVDIDKDELSFFPILYWPVRDDASPLSDATLAKVDAFMKQGGLIVFDTRDHETGSARRTGQGADSPDRPARHSAARAGARKSRPHQVVLPDAEFPAAGMAARCGSRPSRSTRPSAASARAARRRKSIVITSNDLAGAWALDERTGRSIRPCRAARSSARWRSGPASTS